LPYTGPYGVSCFSNANSADITTNFNNHPWCNIFRSWNKWKNFETSYNNFTWGGLPTSLELAIDNGFKLIIALSMGADAPTWVYSNNTGGKVDKIHLYDDSSDATGYDCTYPMDPDLRNHWIRILDALDTLLDTSYGGVTYRDAVAFVTTGAGQTKGTEMTIGDAGDSRNTSAWAAFDTTYGYGSVSARRAAYEAAWEADIQASLAHLTSVPISLATAGSTWGAGRTSTDNVVNWCDANLTADADRNRMLFGPTDMRVDSPDAVSYAAWSANADANLLNIRAKGFTCWAQSAGWTNWWSKTFTGGTLNAMETAFLTDALNTYNVVIMEIQPDQYGHVAGLETWAQDTLQPAIVATAPSGNGGPGVPTTIDADWSAVTIPVPTANTIVQGPDYACSGVVIISDPGNAGVVCFGGPDVHAQTAHNKGFKLQPGQASPRISITNTNVLFFDAATSGDKFLVAIIA
jgi:hypothetical protein